VRDRDDHSDTIFFEVPMISKETVRNHVQDVLRALGARSRLDAVALSRGN
jgi:hypothetical protein